MREGKELVFIACQPRSGSTLLQKILGSHSSIHTVSEPWIMLPPASTLKEMGASAKYSQELPRTGIRNFWEDLPEGRDDYIDGMRRMYGFLYQRVLEEKEASIFLDKTPRYYLILSELKEIFPEARFILLVRNPMAVLSSILRTWVGKQWLKLSYYRSDLLKAPDLLKGMASDSRSKVAMVQYEELVRRPQSKAIALCEHLGIEFEPEMTEYGSDDQEKWRFGDPGSVYEHSEPHTTSLEKWTRPDNAQQWQLLRDYTRELGKETFEALGYDFEETIQKLEASRPRDSRLRYTISLNWILRHDMADRSRWERHGVQMLSSMREEGGRAVMRYLGKRLINRLK